MLWHLNGLGLDDLGLGRLVREPMDGGKAASVASLAVQILGLLEELDLV